MTATAMFALGSICIAVALMTPWILVVAWMWRHRDKSADQCEPEGLDSGHRAHKLFPVRERRSDEDLAQQTIQSCVKLYQDGFQNGLDENREHWRNDPVAIAERITAPPARDWAAEVRNTTWREYSSLLIEAMLKGRWAGEEESKRRQPQQFDLFGGTP